MSGVQFENDGEEFTSRKILGENIEPKMVTMLTKMGVAKNKKQSAHILTAIAVLFFGISFVLFARLLF